MAKELQQTLPEARRKRVQRLKKMVIGIVAAGIVIPLLCCVYLICRLHTIDGTLKTLEQRLDELDIRNQELQTLLQQLQEQKSTPVQTPQIQEDSPGAEASEPVAEESFGQEEIHKVYLTFDDGPSIYTNDILDILDSYNVKATFFVVGKEGTNAEEALQGSLTKDIRWECIHTVINIRNCTNQWTVLHRILPGSGTPSIRPPEWRVSVTGSRVEAPIRSARSICMILSIIWTVREWNTTTGMCPPETAEA